MNFYWGIFQGFCLKVSENFFYGTAPRILLVIVKGLCTVFLRQCRIMLTIRSIFKQLQLYNDFAKNDIFPLFAQFVQLSSRYFQYYLYAIEKPYTVKNTVISPYFLVRKLCGKAQFPHSFRRLRQTMRKLCLSTKFPHQEIRWNYGVFLSDNL